MDEFGWQRVQEEAEISLYNVRLSDLDSDNLHPPDHLGHNTLFNLLTFIFPHLLVISRLACPTIS